MALMSTEFLQLMGNTITVYARTAEGFYGAETFSSTGTDYRCYIDYTPRKIIDNQGREVNTYATIYVRGTGITVTDRIVLPDGSTSNTTLSVRSLYDEDGAVYGQVVYLG